MPKTVTELKRQILQQAREDTALLLDQIQRVVIGQGAASAMRAWESGRPSDSDDVMLTKDPNGVPSGAVLSRALSPQMERGSDPFTGKIRFWHKSTLDAVTMPGGQPYSFPIWEAMNWGSGPNWRPDQSIVERDKALPSQIGSRTVPMRTKGLSRSRSRAIRDKTPSEFVWWGTTGQGYGDRSQGFYVHESRLGGMMSRVKMDPKGRLAQSFAGITQMKYFQPTYFLETSTSTVLQGMKELFRAAKLKPGTNPIR